MERIICLVIGYLLAIFSRPDTGMASLTILTSGNTEAAMREQPMLCVHWERKRALSRIF